MRPVARLYIIFILVTLSGCDFSGSISARSGTADDDYVEEPLAPGVKKFETALVTSNNILRLMSQSRFNDLHRIYFSELMKSQMTRSQFRNVMDKIRQSAGRLKTYKEMQWNFFSGANQGIDLLFSVKIVEHENSMMKYLFVFEKDKPYSNLVGFSAKKYQAVSAPGTF